MGLASRPRRAEDHFEASLPDALLEALGAERHFFVCVPAGTPSQGLGRDVVPAGTRLFARGTGTHQKLSFSPKSSRITSANYQKPFLIAALINSAPYCCVAAPACSRKCY